MGIRVTTQTAPAPDSAISFPFMYRLATGAILARVYCDMLRRRDSATNSDIIVTPGDRIFQRTGTFGLPDRDAWELRLQGEQITLTNYPAEWHPNDREDCENGGIDERAP